MYKCCHYNTVCKNENISITINNIFLAKATNNLSNLYRLHMFMIKIIIGKPYMNHTSMHYNYCSYEDKIFFSIFLIFCLMKIYIVIISIFYSYI